MQLKRDMTSDATTSDRVGQRPPPTGRVGRGTSHAAEHQPIQRHRGAPASREKHYSGATRHGDRSPGSPAYVKSKALAQHAVHADAFELITCILLRLGQSSLGAAHLIL